MEIKKEELENGYKFTCSTSIEEITKKFDKAVLEAVAKNYALKNFSTKELTEELALRGGVDVVFVDVEDKYKIIVDDKVMAVDKGPATLLINID